MEVFLDIVTEQDLQQSWNEVAAERSGQPVKHAVKPVETPAAPVEVKPDPMAEMLAKITELEKVAGRVRNIESTVGNINHTQKQLKETIDAANAVAARSNNAPSQSEIKQASANTAKWDALKSDYPEWADATEELIVSRVNNFDDKAFEAKIREDMKGETASVRKEIINASLDAVFPDWQYEVNTPEFLLWKDAQQDGIKSLYDSNRVGDAAKMLRLYEKSKEVNPENQIVEQRKQTLNAATATPKGVRVPNNVQKSYQDMTADEKWAYEARSRAKRG